MITVVGGGPAGRIAAMRLAAEQKEVVLIDRGKLGGQCLHHGCMVVCALNDVARLIEEAGMLHSMGLLDSAPEVLFSGLLGNMGKIQSTIENVLITETEEAGVTVIQGREARVDGNTVIIGDETLESDAVLIATGSRPFLPDIAGIDLPGVYTAHTISAMKELPRRIAIIGCGVIGAEFAYIFQGLGSSVELICRSRLLSGFDDSIARVARKDLAAVAIREHTSIERLEGRGRLESVVVSSDEGEEVIHADAVMVAAGLVPRSESIAGVEKTPNGAILVDGFMRTSVEGVYAAGDVTGPPYLTPVARREGLVAADAILGKERTIDYRWVPRSIKLRYDHSFCAIPSETALSAAIPSPAGSGSFWWVPQRYTGISRVSFEPEDGRITGFSTAAPASSMIAPYLVYLMRKGIRLDDLDDFMESHPSTDGMYGLIRYAADRLNRQRS